MQLRILFALITFVLLWFVVFFSSSNFVLGWLWLVNNLYFLNTQKWHPDKQKDQDSATSRFQDINEAYQGIYLFILCFVAWIILSSFIR